jgi:hypothetical protein
MITFTLAGSLLFADIIYNVQDLHFQPFLWKTILKTESTMRASICRVLAPIRLGWRREPLITARQIADLEDYLEPGDIILTRDNLKLSALFIPGFWTHAALYLGRQANFAAYFAALPDLEEIGAFADLKKSYQRVLQVLRADAGTIIEAVPDGVGTYPLSHLGPTDYLAVLRPLLPRETKLKALDNALALNGNVYDFYFDFDSKDALICSELVYHAYLPQNGNPGLQFPLYLRNGRRFMSANDIAKKYSMDYGSAAQRLACIVFIDGMEAEKINTIRVSSTFRETWVREPVSPWAR